MFNDFDYFKTVSLFPVDGQVAMGAGRSLASKSIIPIIEPHSEEEAFSTPLFKKMPEPGSLSSTSLAKRGWRESGNAACGSGSKCFGAVNSRREFR
ncbi:MAG: hypothetical protein ACLP05_04555 [Candidatus Kryptoniota bacterium]